MTGGTGRPLWALADGGGTGKGPFDACACCCEAETRKGRVEKGKRKTA